MIRWCCAFAFIFVFVLVCLDSRANELPATPAIEFIYINATEGEAAAGHSAIKFGQTVFHFQYHANGLLLLSKQGWEEFRYYYNDLSNRTIKIRSIALSATAYQQIRDTFHQRYITQEMELAMLNSLREQVHFVTNLLEGNNAVVINGTGLFTTEDGTAGNTGDDLLRRVEAFFSPEDLAAFQEEIHSQLSRIVQNMLVEHAEPQQEGNGVDEVDIESLKEKLALHAAVGIIRGKRGLRTDSIVRLKENHRPLSYEQQQSLIKFQENIIQSIIELIRSKRSDAGPVLLVQIARFLVIGQSLEDNELLTLYPYRSMVTDDDVQGYLNPEVFRLLYDEALFFAERSVRTFFSSPSPQSDISYSIMEKAQGRLSLYEQAIQGTIPDWTRYEKCGTPCRNGQVSLENVLEVPDRISEDIVEKYQQNLEKYTSYLHSQYGYQLYAKNCSTELVQTVNESFGSKNEIALNLGGHIDAGAGMSYVPVGLDNAVLTTFTVKESLTLPAYRIRNVQRIEDKSIATWLRESNTITSSLYSPWVEDSYFLFFTDNTVIPRPIFGLGNIGYGILQTISGMVTAPFDRGRRFLRGVNGIVFSVPELLFFNIRKGSYQVVSPGDI